MNFKPTNDTQLIADLNAQYPGHCIDSAHLDFLHNFQTLRPDLSDETIKTMAQHILPTDIDDYDENEDYDFQPALTRILNLMA